MKRRRTFYEWFEDFLKYNINGNVSQNFVTPEGYKLGSWVKRVRDGSVLLSQEEMDLLDENNFVWKVYTGRWSFSESLREFIKYNKNGMVDINFVTPEGYHLGRWYQYINNRKNLLSVQQIRLLNKYGFAWYEVKRYRSMDEWIADFVKYNKDGYISSGFVTPEGYSLGSKMSYIRSHLEILTKEQVDLLNTNNFNWNKSNTTRSFAEWFRDFVTYQEDGTVPYYFVTPEGNALGLWAARVREGTYKITDEQRECLNQYNFVWKKNNSPRTFDEWFIDFEKYQENGSVSKDFKTPEGYNLGIWFLNVKYGKIETTNEQKIKLLGCGVRFGPKVRAMMQ